jgi:hypothetical protein
MVRCFLKKDFGDCAITGSELHASNGVWGFAGEDSWEDPVRGP